MFARIEAVVHRFRSLGKCVFRLPLVVVLPVLLLGIPLPVTAETSDSAWIAGIYEAADCDEDVRNPSGVSLLTSSARGATPDQFLVLGGVVTTLVTAPVDAVAASALPPRSPPRV